MINVGEKIRILRKKLNKSLKEVAIEIGVSPSFLSKIETNEKKCSLETLDKICKALGITLTDFFSEDTLKNPSATLKTQKLIEKISELSDESIEHLEKQAELLKIKESLDKATDETSVTVLKEGSSDS